MALRAQYYLSQSGYNSSRFVISLLCNSHKRYFSVYVYVRFCMYQYACVECVLSQNQNTTLAQPQQYNASRASSSCICASSHRCMCVWLVHSRTSNHDNIFTSNATIKHTSSDFIRVHESYSMNCKRSSSYVPLACLCSPFSAHDALGISIIRNITLRTAKKATLGFTGPKKSGDRYSEVSAGSTLSQMRIQPWPAFQLLIGCPVLLFPIITT